MEVYRVIGKCTKNRDMTIYNEVLRRIKSPFKSEANDLNLYINEPFYQMMRQTLLAEVCIKNNEHDCKEYKLIHVIPEKNIKLINSAISDKLQGKNISEEWRMSLANPEMYISTSPKKLLSPLYGITKYAAIMDYLQKRYWND